MIHPSIDKFADLLARLPADEASQVLPEVLREIWATDTPAEIRVMVQDAIIDAVNRACAARMNQTRH